MIEFYNKLHDGGAGHVNIFQLSADPVTAAREHCDKHVVKMVLETAQLLSTVWHLQASPYMRPITEADKVGPLKGYLKAHAEKGQPKRHVADLDGPVYSGEEVHLLGGQRIYKPTHAGHPCTEWARLSVGNYKWLWALGVALAHEYTYRYGKTHATEPVLWALERLPPGLAAAPMSWMPPVMPDQFKVIDADGCYDTVASYRKYIWVEKAHFCQWTRRDEPEWWPPF
jgi:hypothetical protein